jgi:hypothetical protein
MSFFLFFFFYNIGEQKSRTDLAWGLVPWDGGGYKERVKEGEYGENIMCSYMKMEK